MIDIESIKHKTIEEMNSEEHIILLFALNDEALKTVNKMLEIFTAMDARIDAIEETLNKELIRYSGR